MKSVCLGVFFLGALCGGASAQQLASAAPTPATAPPSAISFEDAVSCATNYQLHAGEAEMQGLKAAKKARFAAGDKAAEQAAKLGEQSGKSAGAVQDEIMARLDKAAAKPPSRAALTVAAKRCDSLLALTTP